LEILLVEDNPTDAELALLAIRQSGFPGAVVHVDDGTGVLDYLHGRGAFADRAGGGRPQVIFLDLKLPGMNGIDVLRVIKGNAELSIIPIVMLTSSQELSDVSDCYRLGVNSFVVKPVGFDSYRAVMKELVSYWTRVNLPPVGEAAPR
jgi:CheY-like chemotaxis protein